MAELYTVFSGSLQAAMLNKYLTIPWPMPGGVSVKFALRFFSG